VRPSAAIPAYSDADMYRAHRARALALAGEGDGDSALAELNRGWGDEWPDPASYAVDVARVRFLAGDHDDALEALRLALRGTPSAPSVAAVAAACVRAAPHLWTRALRLALDGGSPLERLRLVIAVARARL
jgi:hypothetical protein